MSIKALVFAKILGMIYYSHLNIFKNKLIFMIKKCAYLYDLSTLLDGKNILGEKALGTVVGIL